jgi:DNA repair exonuclease SbcCD ATPase subunit
MVQKLNLPTDENADNAILSVSNLGGIENTTVEFSPGVTILVARNATNRTSLLRALNGTLGGTAATLKSDTDNGHATLTLGDDEFTRTYRRTGSGTTSDGTPYTDAVTLVDSFVTLLEDNPARRVVERGEDLHEVIMRPVDTEAIEQRIQQLREKKEEVEADRDRAQQRRDTLPQLEERRHSLEEEIVTIDEKLVELREEVADIDADAKAAEEADILVEKLDARQQNLRGTENDIEIVKSERDALHDELDEIRADREALSENVDDRSDIKSELESLRDEKRQLDNTITSLRTIVEFNEDLLVEDGYKLPRIDPGDKNIMSALDPDENQDVVCWTCGSHVKRGTIANRLEDLCAVIEEKQAERADLTERIDYLQEDLQSVEQHQRRRDELDRTIVQTEQKIEQREQRLEALKTTAADLRKQIQNLESNVAETKDVREGDFLETYEQVSDLEYERGQLKHKLTNVEDEIADINTSLNPNRFEEQLDKLTTKLERERTRIADLEAEAVDQFNIHMDNILEILTYQNLTRVWIERKTGDSGRGPRETVFDLHVVRENNEGTVYEDTTAHLSESEREVVGLVVALAGYLAHVAYEKVPFILLDSLEAIDAERIAALVDYFADYAPHLVVALLPDDASALSDNYQRLTAETLGT